MDPTAQLVIACAGFVLACLQLLRSNAATIEGLRAEVKAAKDDAAAAKAAQIECERKCAERDAEHDRQIAAMRDDHDKRIAAVVGEMEELRAAIDGDRSGR